MKIKTFTLLLSLATAASLPAQIIVTVADNVPNGTASGGTGNGPGVLTTTFGTLVSDVTLPVTTYTVSGLDFTSIGGMASESFTFTVSYTATTDGTTPGSAQFTVPFGNVSVTGGTNNLVDGDETLTATIALTSTTFANLTLTGLTYARVGAMASGKTGTIAWDGGANGTSSIFFGNTIVNPPTAGVTSFTLTNGDGAGLNIEGFGAQFTAIPEPSSAALVAALALGGVVLLRRRRPTA